MSIAIRIFTGVSAAQSGTMLRRPLTPPSSSPGVMWLTVMPAWGCTLVNVGVTMGVTARPAREVRADTVGAPFRSIGPLAAGEATVGAGPSLAKRTPTPWRSELIVTSAESIKTSAAAAMVGRSGFPLIYSA